MGNVTQKNDQEMYASLAGEDRMYFSQVARSKFIGQAMRDKNFIAHSSPTTFSIIVSATEELKKLKSNWNRMVVFFYE